MATTATSTAVNSKAGGKDSCVKCSDPKVGEEENRDDNISCEKKSSAAANGNDYDGLNCNCDIKDSIPTVGRSPTNPDEGDVIACSSPRSTCSSSRSSSPEPQSGNEAAKCSKPQDTLVMILADSHHSDVKDKYDIEPTDIGCGNYGLIRQCSHRETGQKYALKSIPKTKAECKLLGVKNPSKTESIRREAEILKQVQHPRIVRLVDTYEDAKCLHLVTEMCAGGMMFDRVIAKDKKPYTERQMATLVKSILEAVAYLHNELNVVHRDIKLENFLFENDDNDCLSIKLIDFGMSRADPLTSPMHTSIGTSFYIAPEVLSKKYGKSCDMWSVGVVTYMIICGYYPFYGDSTAQILKHVKSGKFDYPAAEWKNVSSAAKDFVSGLLTVDVDERLTAAEAMVHPWILKQTGPKKSLSRSFSKGIKKRVSSLGSKSK